MGVLILTISWHQSSHQQGSKLMYFPNHLSVLKQQWQQVSKLWPHSFFSCPSLYNGTQLFSSLFNSLWGKFST